MKLYNLLGIHNLIDKLIKHLLNYVYLMEKYSQMKSKYLIIYNFKKKSNGQSLPSFPFCFLVSKQPPPLLPGDRLSLACNAETLPGLERPEIHWLNPQGEKMRTNKPTITATGQHNGQWFCVVTLANKEKKAKVFVTVLGELPHTHMYSFHSSVPSI